MRSKFWWDGVFILALLGYFFPPQKAHAENVPNSAVDKAAEHPLQQLAYLDSFDTRWIDKTKNPCVDFYEYACTNWKKQHPIAADQKDWTFAREISVQNEQYLWGLLLKASDPKSMRTPEEQKLGDAFATCMNEDLLESKGLSDIQEELNRIEKIKNLSDLSAFLGFADRFLPGSGVLWGFYVAPNLHDATHHLLHFSAIKLGLPNRDYYLDLSQKMQEKRARYQKYILSILQLAGVDSNQAEQSAAQILQLETLLAKSLLSPTEMRNPRNTDHLYSWQEVQSLLPSITLAAYRDQLGMKKNLSTKVNVSQPAYFKALNQELQKDGSLPLWKTYLQWRILNGYAPYLNSAFREANFQFYDGYLNGVKAQKPRWRQCVSSVASTLRDSIGPLFIQKTFSPDAKAEITDIVHRVKAVLRSRLQSASWMQEQTRAAALRKLDATIEKIAYPNHWRDHRALTITPTSYVGNLKRITAFEMDWHLGKIGQRVDRTEWLYPVTTINAFYEGNLNAIMLLAGYLQSPFYDQRMILPAKYGILGFTSGHEYIHGFDDRGRQYDAEGNLRDWWAPADDKSFRQQAQCTLQQYNQYMVNGTPLNGQLTLGENIADLGGLSLAFEAWSQVGGATSSPEKDGFTPAQQFFLAFAFSNCENVAPAYEQWLIQNDVHALGKHRVNGVLSNMPAFQKAFSCRADQPMVRKNQCHIW